MSRTKRSQGRGWFGNSDGHRKAGRQGGLARGRKNAEASEPNTEINLES